MKQKDWNMGMSLHQQFIHCFYAMCKKLEAKSEQHVRDWAFFSSSKNIFTPKFLSKIFARVFGTGSPIPYPHPGHKKLMPPSQHVIYYLLAFGFGLGLTALDFGWDFALPSGVNSGFLRLRGGSVLSACLFWRAASASSDLIDFTGRSHKFLKGSREQSSWAVSTC